MRQLPKNILSKQNVVSIEAAPKGGGLPDNPRIQARIIQTRIRSALTEPLQRRYRDQSR